jgi:phosphohistidine swiveling domain-containing protein
MITTTQSDVLSHLHGVKVTDEGTLKPDWSSFSLPDYFQTKESLSAGEQSAGNTFFGKLSQLANRSVSRLWGERNLAVPGGAFADVLALALAQAGGVSAQDASALASYAGGAAFYNGVFGISSQPLSPSEYLEPDKLVDAVTRSTNIGAALNRLKAANPLAHKYLVALVGAKAAKKKVQDQVILAKETQKVINKELEIASNIVTGGTDTLAAGAWLVKNLPWILGITAAIAGYYVFRNRDVIESKVREKIQQA